MQTFTLFNEDLFVCANVDEKDGFIAIDLAHRDKPLIITKDDEMYQHNLDSLTRVKNNILAKAKKAREAEQKAKEAKETSEPS